MSRKTPKGPFTSLVVLGESTVQGGGWIVSEDERYADILWRLLETAQERPLKYYNAGVGASVISPKSPGYEASVKPSAAERLDKEVIARKPDLLVIAYGLNDMRAGMRVDDFRAEMKKIIRRVRKAISPMIVIVNVYHQSAYHFYAPFTHGSVAVTKRYNKMLKELSEEFGCVYSDVWAAEGQKDHLIHLDTVHANKIGNMIIAHKVFESIVHAAPNIGARMDKRDAKTDWSRAILERQRERLKKSRASKPGR